MGPIFVGSPQQIIDKLMYERELFALDRFLGQVDIGGLPYAKVAQVDRADRDASAAGDAQARPGW